MGSGDIRLKLNGLPLAIFFEVAVIATIVRVIATAIYKKRKY